jgi:glutathione S-transferase
MNEVCSFLEDRGRRTNYSSLLPSDEVYKTIILPMTSIAMIPVLLVSPGTEKQYAIQDSKAIMEFFETRYPSHSAPLVPREPKQRFVSMLLELLADEWLVVQAMYWRWAPESLEKQRTFLEYEFGHASTGGRGTFQEKLTIGKKVRSVHFGSSPANARKKTQRFASFCPGLGITPATSPALLKQFHSLLSLLSAHLEQHDFLLGQAISAADFAFYGTFYAHLSRDPVPGFVIKTQAPLVAAWVERVGMHRQARRSGSAPSHGDEIPATLLPVLQLLMADFVPVLFTTSSAVLEFLARNPGKEIARHFRPAGFRLRLGGEILAEGTRNVSTHCVWMLQRILDAAYGGDARHACEEVLGSVDGADSSIARQWRETVELWQRSGWRVARNPRNQLVGQRMSSTTRL